MKKVNLLLVMAFLFIGMSANAERRPVWHRMEDPIKITERGIDFFIFPNGDFDFNAHNSYYGGDYGVRVERDNFGKIRRVGNVYLNYTRAHKVSRIGKVFIRYNRRGMIQSIGRMHLRYGRSGYAIHRYRPYNYYYNSRPGYSYSSSYYYGNNYYNNTYSNNTYSYENSYYNNDTDYETDYENEDDYYYRSHNRRKETTKKKKFVKNRRR